MHLSLQMTVACVHGAWIQFTQHQLVPNFVSLTNILTALIKSFIALQGCKNQGGWGAVAPHSANQGGRAPLLFRLTDCLSFTCLAIIIANMLKTVIYENIKLKNFASGRAKDKIFPPDPPPGPPYPGTLPPILFLPPHAPKTSSYGPAL